MEMRGPDMEMMLANQYADMGFRVNCIESSFPTCMLYSGAQFQRHEA